MSAFAVRKSSEPYFAKAKPAKSADYLSFVRQLPCIVTGSRTDIQAAHLSSAALKYGHLGRGKGRKASDRWAIPMCSEQHSKQHHTGNEMAYWKSTGRDPHMIALVLFGLWSDLGDDAIEFAERIIYQEIQS